jgi:phosphoribosylformylglycinamidine synthase
VYGQLGDEGPDIDRSESLASFFALVQTLHRRGLFLAYHDVSDGGLFVALAEMTFASRCGVDVDLGAACDDPLAALFAEEPGAVVQVRQRDVEAVVAAARDAGIAATLIGTPGDGGSIRIDARGSRVFDEARVDLHRAWSATTHAMQRLRDNPLAADQEYARLADQDDRGLVPALTFDAHEDVAAPFIGRGARPRVAILREQGVNGQVEMAAAFTRAGFDAYDVHMTDLETRRHALATFQGIVACGGFSYGDVLGAGEGWAKSILFHSRLRDAFSEYFARPDTFALGVCNGCQMMSALREIIPGTQHWPRFVRNRSEQFEGRLSLVEVVESPSLFFAGMAGSRMPIAVAHGEGRAEFAHPNALDALVRDKLLALRFVENDGRPAERYPANPNGSPRGLTGITTPDGRVTLLMPHPERVYRTAQNSWHPDEWGEDSPWMRIWRNARVWVG